MAEILDLYDGQGNRLGKTMVRGEKAPENCYIKLAVIWVKAKDKYLIQKCSVQKGGEYAVTGGHVPSGMTSYDQAFVEVEEELGLQMEKSKFKQLGNLLIKHAIFDVYQYEDDNLIDQTFTLQEEEVEKVVWFNTKEIEELIESGQFRKSSAAHFTQFIQEKTCER